MGYVSILSTIKICTQHKFSLPLRKSLTSSWCDPSSNKDPEVGNEVVQETRTRPETLPSLSLVNQYRCTGVFDSCTASGLRIRPRELYRPDDRF